MNIELLLFIERHTDTLIEQTKPKAQETLEFKLNKQMEAFSFSPPINLVDEGKRFLGVTSFETTNSVFNLTRRNNRFSISIPSTWQTISAEKTFDNYINY